MAPSSKHLGTWISTYSSSNIFLLSPLNSFFLCSPTCLCQESLDLGPCCDELPWILCLDSGKSHGTHFHHAQKCSPQSAWPPCPTLSGQYEHPARLILLNCVYPLTRHLDDFPIRPCKFSLEGFGVTSGVASRVASGLVVLCPHSSLHSPQVCSSGPFHG